MLSHRLFGLCCSLRFCWVVLVAVVFFCGSSTWAITITITYESVGAEPAADPNGTKLKNLAQYVASVYEDIIEDVHAMEYVIRYEVVGFTNGSFSHLEPNNATNRSTKGRVRINPTPDNDPAKKFYYDLTPADDSEYDMQQWLFRDLSNTLQTERFNGNTPDVFEAGYRGVVAAGAPVEAQSATDLLTILFHEMGHGLGLSGSLSDLNDPNGPDETDDGDFDVSPAFVNGNVMALNVRDTGSADSRAHVFGASPENFAVMSRNSTNARRRPSATDLFAMASVASWTSLDLRRQDFLGGGDWNTAFNWMGGQVPLSLDAAFVRHGFGVTLNGLGNVASLLIDNASSVDTQTNLLIADVVDIQKTTGGGTPRLIVNNLGDLISEIVTVDNGARLEILGGNAEIINRLFILAGGELRGFGTVDISGIVGEFTSDGLIRATNGGELVITSGNNLALDLNGTIEAIDGDLRFETGMLTAMTATMTVGAGRQVAFNSGGSIGTGGSLQLEGTSVSPATSIGSNLFVGSGGFINANGLGVVENTLILQPSGSVTTEFGDPNSEIRLNGTTLFQGGNIVGDGIARQNGNAFVSADTTISIDTYDMDGVLGNTTTTIDPDTTLDINSPNIDVGINDFDGTIHVNSGTLDVAPSWLLEGTINLNQTAFAVPVLTGDGILTIRLGGQLNISGSGNINQQVIIEGGVFAGSEADFNQITSFTSTAIVETFGPGDAIDLNGITTMAGGSYTGNGAIKFDNQVFITQNTSISMADTDLDGDSGSAEINIQPNVTFSIFSSSLELSANDGFDGVMNNQGTFFSTVAFRLDGQLNMMEFGGATTPTLDGVFGFTIFTTGEMNTDGDAFVNRDTTVQGDMNIGLGVTQINGTASFESTATVTVAAGGELELNGAATFLGGSYTGAGLIQLNATTMVDSATTIATDSVDLDGAGENTQITVNDTSFVLNVDRIDVTNNLFAGVMNVTGNSALLAVNLSNPLLSWRLSSVGTLNFTTSAASPVTMLDGSDLAAEGAITADGRVRLGVNVGLGGSLTTADLSTDVHFDGGGRSFIFNTATLSGPGQITIDNLSTMNLEDGANVGVDVENDGRLEIGFFATEVSIDVIEPGAATIRGDFSQTTDGEFAVDLSGLLQGTEFDWLNIIGTARLNGTIEVQLIDNFQPSVGDTFQVLTATSVIGTFDTIVTIDESNMFGFEVTAIYSATDVVLQIDDVFLSADFDHDDDVDGTDFLIWQVGLGLMMETDNTNGDANGDGLVNAEDLSIWENQYGSVFSPLVAAAAVPEPSGCVLLVLGAIGLLRRRCQHRLDRSPSTFRRSARE